jgi:hypothetical protein
MCGELRSIENTVITNRLSNQVEFRRSGGIRRSRGRGNFHFGPHVATCHLG